jgi:putative endonuclease
MKLKENKAQKIGNAGENMAVEWLTSAGYSIIARNYRFEKAEIDIIAQKEALIIFVEVKTRSRSCLQQPENAVSVTKQQHLFRAATAFLEMHRLNHLPARFDIISIALDQDPPLIHIEDAFTQLFTL